jgi:hypothetical protein
VPRYFGTSAEVGGAMDSDHSLSIEDLELFAELWMLAKGYIRRQSKPVEMRCYSSARSLLSGLGYAG